MKFCNTCKQWKDESEFFKDKYKKDGLKTKCKQCVLLYQQTSPKNKAYHQKYYQEHKKEYDERAAKWRDDNRDLLNERFRTRYHPTQLAYYKKRRNEDSIFRLRSTISGAINSSLKKYTKGFVIKNHCHWEDLVGYTLNDLVIHLESLFQEGMTWDNYGQWHVDHIKPVSSFHITSLECDEFKKCWSLDNLQPLWAKDNLRKSNKIGPEWGNDK